MLPKSFFNRSSVIVAKELLGLFLCTPKGKFKIIETEAYEGFEDKASHASRGKTLRNAPMFGESGTIYVYFTYGMHYILNIVCGKKGHPSAVLVRGLSAENNSSLSLARDPSLTTREGKKPNLFGPARLTKYLQIDKSLNNKKLGRASGLWVEDDPTPLKLRGSKQIENSPRIGVDYAGPFWSQKPWRFVLVEK